MADGILKSYRILDLTNEKGALCGKMLADLGADVIKIEPPEGDSSRRRGPFSFVKSLSISNQRLGGIFS